MFSVSFLVKNSPIAMMFTFKAHKLADDLYKKGCKLLKTDGVIEMKDDYGMESSIDMSSIAAVNKSEYEQEMKKNGDIQILQAKQDLKTKTMAQQDIGLRMLGDEANRAEQIPGEHKLKVS